MTMPVVMIRVNRLMTSAETACRVLVCAGVLGTFIGVSTSMMVMNRTMMQNATSVYAHRRTFRMGLLQLGLLGPTRSRTRCIDINVLVVVLSIFTLSFRVQ